VCAHFVMATFMLENGNVTRWKDEEYSNMRVVTYTLENGRMTREKDEERIDLAMVISMMEYGKMTKWKNCDCSNIITEIISAIGWRVERFLPPLLRF
jgi:hypothetical protein